MIGTSERMNMETVSNVFTIVHVVINEQEKALKQQIAEIETKNRTLIEDYQTQLKRKEQYLNEKKKYFGSIVSANDHTKLLQTKEQLTTSLTDMTKELDELKPPVKTEYDIKGIEQLQASIDDMLKQVHIVIQTPGNSFFKLTYI